MNVLSLFDGLSCGQIALNRAGIEYDNYFASEIDKYAIQVAQYNYPKTIQLGDITKWKEWDLPKIDLVMGGSPCQGFSFAGKQLNFDDPRSKLFFEFVRLFDETKPEYFLLENVKMKQKYIDIISEKLGVKPFIINSELVSAQNRVRCYWTNIVNNVEIEDKGITIQDLLPECEGIYTVPRGTNKGGIRWNKKKVNCITTSSWQHNFFWVDIHGAKHKFTTCLCEELQTIPFGYTKWVSDNQAYKLIGNGWTVDIIAHIFKGLKKLDIAGML
jgi:site-specific DNA-cytosine methylase